MVYPFGLTVYIVSDVGNVWLDTVIYPNIFLLSIENILFNAIRKLKLNNIVFVEYTEALRNSEKFWHVDSENLKCAEFHYINFKNPTLG